MRAPAVSEQCDRWRVMLDHLNGDPPPPAPEIRGVRFSPLMLAQPDTTDDDEDGDEQD